jgi:hypothetical protein
MNYRFIFLLIVSILVLIILYNIYNSCEDSEIEKLVNVGLPSMDNSGDIYSSPYSLDGFIPGGGIIPDPFPWWNSTRFTRNMSYDLRGDVPINLFPTGPWWNSPLLY